jgi:chromosome segregation ATPase
LRELETQKQRITHLQKKNDEKDARLKVLESQNKQSEDGVIVMKREMETSINEEKRVRRLASELQQEKNDLEEAVEKLRVEVSEYRKKSEYFEEKHTSTLKDLELMKNQRDKVQVDYQKLQNSSAASINELGAKNEEV